MTGSRRIHRHDDAVQFPTVIRPEHAALPQRIGQILDQFALEFLPAEVTVGDKVVMLSENQSTYIPLGTVHRLVNPGTIPLEIIEVQSGSYLGEDDIVRYQDNYGRSGN